MPHSSELPQILANSLSARDCQSNLVKTYNWEPTSLPNWSFCTDTRMVLPGSWFVALKGEQFDGHEFYRQALEKGAAGLIVNANSSLALSLASGEDLSLVLSAEIKVPILVVQSTLVAYQLIARHQMRVLKEKTGLRVIAITGSNGKTSTKEMLLNVLQGQFVCRASLSNENNEIGVPKNLLALTESDQIMISECGMRGLGQIEELCLILEPEITLITCIGTAHIGLLGSRENIAKAKAEIFVNQPSLGYSYLPLSEPLLEPYIKAHEKRLQLAFFGDYSEESFLNGKTSFVYKGFQYSVNFCNQGLIADACAVISVALDLGLSPALIQEGLSRFEPVKGRGQVRQLSKGARVLDETYNANPDSVRELAKSLSVFAGEAKAVLVLGEMAELGDSAPVMLEELAAVFNENLDELLLIGDSAYWQPVQARLKVKSSLFSSVEELFEFFKLNQSYLSAGSTLAFKASRRVRLDELVSRLS